VELECIKVPVSDPVPDPVAERDLDPDPTKNVIKKIKKIKSERPTFWEIMLLPTLKKQDFVQILFC
jgi:hypothetical protein